MTMATRVDRIEGTLRESADLRVSTILDATSHLDIVLILDGLSAERRGDPGPDDWEEAWERLLAKGWELALDRLEEFLTPQELEARAERHRQRIAGELRQ